MQIKVKSVKVIKTGTNEHGEWKFVGVTTDEGVKYTTFAKDADTIPPGSTLNISDMEARHIICPAMIRYAPPIGEGNAHQCPWCAGKVYPEYKVEKCELCGLPYTTEYKLDTGEIETRKSFAEGHGVTFGTGEEAIDWLKQE